MPSRIRALTALLFTCVLFTACPAIAAEQLAVPQPAAPVGHPLVDDLFACLGMLLVGVSALANILPRKWALTRALARFSTDLRGILTPDPDDDPRWVQRIKRRVQTNSDSNT